MGTDSVLSIGDIGTTCSLFPKKTRDTYEIKRVISISNTEQILCQIKTSGTCIFYYEKSTNARSRRQEKKKREREKKEENAANRISVFPHISKLDEKQEKNTHNQ